MKRVLTILVTSLVVFSLILVGCSPAPQASEPSQAQPAQAAAPEEAKTDAAPQQQAEEAKQPESGKKLKFGFIFCGLSIPSTKAGQEAAQKKADELGIDLVVMDGEFDAQKQTDQALNLISQNVDGIIINPQDAEAFVPAARQINEAGIPLVVWVQPLPAEADAYVSTFFGPDDAKAGIQAADMLVKAFPEGQEINAVEIKGPLGSIATQKRAEGLQEALKLHSNLKLLESQSSDGWSRETAMKIMENYLSKYPNIDVVYCHDDGLAQGAAEAIPADRKEKIKVIGINGEPEAFDAIRNGDMYCTMVQHFDVGGAKVIEMLNGIVNGEKFDKWIVDEWVTVTKENVDTASPSNPKMN